MLGLNLPRVTTCFVIPNDNLLGLILMILFRVVTYSEQVLNSNILVRVGAYSEESFACLASELGLTRRNCLRVLLPNNHFTRFFPWKRIFSLSENLSVRETDVLSE